MEVLVWAVLILGIGMLLRSQYERSHLVVDVYECETDKLGSAWDGYTMAVLADLHGNQLGRNQEDLITALEQVQPDVVLIAGDMITERDGRMPDLEPLWDLLERLTVKYPVYYANGNHEARMEEHSSFDRWLKEMGIIHLADDSVWIRKEDGAVCVTGLNLDLAYYWKKGQPLPMQAVYLKEKLGEADPKAFQLLLAHNPLYFAEYARWGADLTVSGHFHGGTIRLPYVGGVMTPQYQFFYPHTRGMYESKENGSRAKLVVSAGLGTHSINLRLNNQAHLPVIRLKANGKTVKDAV